MYAVSTALAHPLQASETSKHMAFLMPKCYAYKLEVLGSVNPLVVDPSMMTPILDLYFYKG